MPLGDVGVIGSATGRNFDDALAAAAGYAASSHADAISAAASAASASPAAFYASLPAAIRNQLDGYFPSLVADIGRSQQFLNGAAASSDLSAIFSRVGGTKRVIGPTGTLDTVAANTLAFDWSSGRRRLLIEAASATNTITRSQEFDQWTAAGASVSANASAAPDGTITADKLVEGSGAGYHQVYKTPQAVTSGKKYTFSVFARAAERSRFTILSNGVSVPVHQGFDLIAGSTFAPTDIGGAKGTAAIIGLGGGWFRCSVTATATSSGVSDMQCVLVQSGTTESYTGDGTSGLAVWGAQVEEGEVATSYIPTTSAAVTRIADDVRLSAAAPAQVTGAGGCTIALRGSIASNSGGFLVGGAVNGPIVFSAAAGATIIRSDYDVARPASVFGSGGWPAFGICGAWGSSSARICSNGGGVVTSTTSTLWSLADETSIRIGDHTAGGAAVGPQLFLDELVIWTFVGSDTGIRTQARSYT